MSHKPVAFLYICHGISPWFFLNLRGNMIISKKMQTLIANQEGWTRRMFEEGQKIRKEYGEDNIYDFSLGNPDTEPPDPQRTC
jgi:hypothetical protein